MSAIFSDTSRATKELIVLYRGGGPRLEIRGLFLRCLAIVVICTAGGCAQTVHDLATTAGGAAGKSAAVTAPPAVVSGLTELNKPEPQRQLQNVAQSPAVQDVTRTLGNGLGRGMVDEIVSIAVGASTTQPTTAPSLTTTQPLRAGQESLPTFVSRNIDPAIAEIIHSIVRESTASATSPQAQAGARAMAEALGDGAVCGAIRATHENGPMIGKIIREQLVPAMSDAVRQQLDPALDGLSRQRLMVVVHDLLQQEIVPAIRRAWDEGAADTLLIAARPDMSHAVVQNAQNLSAGAAFGTQDAMIQLGMLSRDGGPTKKAEILLWGALAVVALIGVAAAALIVVLVMAAIALRQGRLSLTANRTQS